MLFLVISLRLESRGLDGYIDPELQVYRVWHFFLRKCDNLLVLCKYWRNMAGLLCNKTGKKWRGMWLKKVTLLRCPVELMTDVKS